MKERNATHSVVDVFTAYLGMKAAQNKFKIGKKLKKGKVIPLQARCGPEGG